VRVEGGGLMLSATRWGQPSGHQLIRWIPLIRQLHGFMWATIQLPAPWLGCTFTCRDQLPSGSRLTTYLNYRWVAPATFSLVDCTSKLNTSSLMSVGSTSEVTRCFVVSSFSFVWL
jgi:hypothetical protein